MVVIAIAVATSSVGCMDIVCVCAIGFGRMCVIIVMCTVFVVGCVNVRVIAMVSVIVVCD